jgi:WD40 repeat protein
VAFSPDGQFLLASSQPLDGSQTGEMIMWDVQNCVIVRQFEDSVDIPSISFSSDGKRAVTGIGFKGRAALWDLTTGEVIGSYPWTDSAGPVLGVTFGPGDQTILGSGVSDLYLWDVATKHIIRRYTGLATFPFTIDLSQDSKYVISGTSKGEVIVWNFTTGEEVSRINTHFSVWCFIFY